MGLGTLLIAVAAVVFTAVNWSRMDAAAQGLVLLALTAVSAAATVAAGRRRLPTTAEALGVVTVLLGLVDLHALRISMWPGTDLLSFWAGGLTVAAGAAWFLADGARIRSSRMVAVTLGQIPVGLALTGAEVEFSVVSGVLIAQTGLVLAAARRLVSVDRFTRASAAVMATGVWTAVTGWSVILVWADGIEYESGFIAVVALSAAVAALAAWLWGEHDGIRPLASVAATFTALVAVGAWFDLILAGPIAWPAVGLVAVLVAAVSLRVDPRWGTSPAVIAAIVAGWVSLAVLRPAAAVVVALGDVTRQADSLDSARPAGDLIRYSTQIEASALALHLAVLAGLVAALAPRLGRALSASAGAVVAVMAVALAPLYLELSVGGAATAGWIGAVVATVAIAGLPFGYTTVGRRGDDGPGELAFSAALRWLAAGSVTAVLAVSSGWSSVSTALTVTNLVVITAVSVGFVAIARRAADAPMALVACGAAVLAGAATAGQVAVATGSTAPAALAVVGVAALVLGLVATLIFDPAGTGRGLDAQVARSGEITGWLVHGYVLAAASAGGDPALWRLTLTSGVVMAALHAARPARRPLAWLAVAEGLLLVWAELAWAQVTAPEPYTLPVAATLLGLGFLIERRRGFGGVTDGPDGVNGPSGPRGAPVADRTASLSSWVTLGPGLVIGVAPTVVTSFGDPGSTRPIAALVAGVVILVAGAVTRRRAPVDIGAAAVATIALVQLAPVVGSLPNWVALGSAGVVLLAVGATFEQRRRDLKGFRDLYSSLR